MSSELTPTDRIVSDDLFGREVRRWASVVDVSPTDVVVSELDGIWGRCEASGRLIFDRDVLNMDIASRSEIIVHELVHLKVGPHGRMFRALVRAYLARGMRASDRIVTP